MSELIKNPENYFSRFVPKRRAFIKELEAEAFLEDIPIVGPVVGELLFVLARIIRAERILELGTATGYSAIFLAEAFEKSNGQLITVENDPVMAARALKNFKRAGLEKLIKIRIGDALEEMISIPPFFDLIFMDIEKIDYYGALPHCSKLLRKNGLLIADNVGFEDADLFNKAIFSSEEFRSVSLFSYLPLHSPEHDGLCLALKL